MSTKNTVNPIDLDVTVQQQNDRISFQYQSIVNRNTGADLLQSVLDANSTLSDSQVEIALNTNDMYTENGTVENITQLLQEAYTLVLPKKNTLQGNTTGILVFQNDPTYVETKQNLDDEDLFQQNSRTRYPTRSLIGSFIHNETFFTNTQAYSQVVSNVSVLESNVSNLTERIIEIEENGGGGGVGTGIIKSESDVNATNTLSTLTGTNITNGDLYFNTESRVFKTYYSGLVNSSIWFNTALTKIAGQPPPVYNLTTTNSTSYIDVSWEYPTQVNSAITSSIAYNTLDSPANKQNDVSQNVIMFPIVNRVVIQLTEVNITTGEDEGVQSYPLYALNGSDTKSTVNSNGYVIYPKGSELTVFDTNDTTHSTYESNTTVINYHELSNMPTTIRLFKSVLNRSQRQSYISSVDPSVIIPFSSEEVGTTLNLSGQKYRIGIWLENNSNSNDIKIKEITNSFQLADTPLAPESVSTSISQPSETSVVEAVTQAKLQVQDPLYVSGNTNDEDQFLNFTGIKFEWSDDNFGTNVYSVSKLRHDPSNPTTETHNDTNEISLSSGIYTVNRSVDTYLRQYTFDLTAEYLGSDWNSLDITQPITISFRVSYLNSSNPSYGPTSSPVFFSIGYPEKPVITNVELTGGRVLTFTLQGIADDDAILTGGVDVANATTNESYGVFIRSLDVQVEYQEDGDSIEEYEVFSGGNYNFNGTTESASQSSNTTYEFVLPKGQDAVAPEETVTAITNLRWRIKVKTKNNVLNMWSQESDITGGSGTDNDTTIDGTATQNLEFTRPNNTNQFTELDYNSDSHTITIDWNNPSDGNRGLDNDKASSGLPRIYENSYNLQTKDPDGTQLSIQSGTQTGSYNSDAHSPGSSISFNMASSITNNGATYNDSAQDNDVESSELYKEVIATVQQKNHFIRISNQIASSRYYSLRPPDAPSTLSTFSSTIRNGSGYNSLSLAWNKPDFQGFRYGGTTQLSSANNTVIDINRYIVLVRANLSNSRSPYLYNFYSPADNVSIQNTIDSGSLTLDASTQMLNIQFNSSLANITGSVNSISDVFVYPDTSYDVEIYNRNTFGLMTTQLTNPLFYSSSRTGTPGSFESIFTTPPVPSGADVSSNNYLYQGFLLDTSDVNNLSAHLELGGDVNITPESVIDLTSSYQAHLMNQAHVMNFQAVTDYMTNAISKKFRQVKIYNAADNDQEELLYGYDNSGTWISFSANTSLGGFPRWSNKITIDSQNNRDVYDALGFDVKNRGYWWREELRSRVNLTNGFQYDQFHDPAPNSYSMPHLLKIQVRYNKSENFQNQVLYDASNLSIDSNVNIVEAPILYNSDNTNQYVYVDTIQLEPQATAEIQPIDPFVPNPYNVTYENYITPVNQTNYINGIPNLYFVNNTNGYEYKLNYRLLNYSNYYGLTNSESFVSHSFTTSNTNVGDPEHQVIKGSMEPRSWDEKDNCTRDTTTWSINNLSITNASVGFPSITTSYLNIGLMLDLKNTYASVDNQRLLPNTSVVFDPFLNDFRTIVAGGTLSTFVYDKMSADLINGTTTILTVEDGFDPNATVYSNTSVNTTAFNWYGVYDNGTAKSGKDVLFLYDGKFLTENSTYQGFYGLLDSYHKYEYGVQSHVPRTPTNPIRWSIFKFETNQFTSTTLSRLFYFNFNTETNLTITDVISGQTSASDTLSETCKIYAQIELYNPTTDTSTPVVYNPPSTSIFRRWIRYSGPYYTTTTLAAASISGSLDANVEDSVHNLQWNNPTNNAEWLDTHYVPKGGSEPNSAAVRTCWGVMKEQTIPSGSTIRIYLAIGLKNTADKYFEKPASVQFVQSATETSTPVVFIAT